MDLWEICRTKKENLNLTMQEIADSAGLPVGTVKKFFSAASKSPSVYTVAPICRVLGVSLDEYFEITDRLTMSEEVLNAKNDTLRAHKKELEKHLVDNDKTMKIMMDGVRTRNRIIAALLVLLCLIAMYALYLDFHCVQLGFWRDSCR